MFCLDVFDFSMKDRIKGELYNILIVTEDMQIRLSQRYCVLEVLANVKVLTSNCD